MVCGSGEIEDEFHFVMICKKYARLRRALLRVCRRLDGDSACLADLFRVDKMNSFVVLMSSPSAASALATFVWDAFKLRQTTLVPQES